MLSVLELVKGGICSCCLDKPTDSPSLPTVRARMDSMASLGAQPRSRARTWSDAIMARLYRANRFSSPPPAYEHPPAYQVALEIETQAEKPPIYSPLETMV